jgi:hypothetical protein
MDALVITGALPGHVQHPESAFGVPAIRITWPN